MVSWTKLDPYGYGRPDTSDSGLIIVVLSG